MESKLQNEPLVDITMGDTTVTLLGTAHVSRASAEKVQELLLTGHYDCVAVELCPSRYNAMLNPDALAKMDLFQVIKEGKAAMVAANLALGAFQQRMAEQLDIKPGAEMRMAIDVSKDMKLPVLLVDREIATTLKRVYRNVPWWQRMNIIGGLLASVVSRHEVSEAEIEKLKEGDVIESTFAQFAEEAEYLYDTLVDERDRYMAARLLQETYDSHYKKILVIIGAGHMKGIQKYIASWLNKKSPEDVKETITDLDFIPLPGRWMKRIPWVIVALVFIGFGIGFSRSPELGWQLIADWVLINGGLASLGALIALAHPVTIVGAFLAAPLTSLNPTIGAGMVTAAIEAYMRKPKVEDFARLRTDTTHLKGWWQNAVTRILMVFILSTLGSAIGTYVAGFKIAGRLAGN